MSVHQFMLGRELPCTVLELLGVRPMPLAGATHDALVRQAEAGRNYPDVLYRLGLSHLGRQELGLARRRLGEAVRLKGDYIPARLALAGVCDLLAQSGEAADHIDAALVALPEKPAGYSRYTLLCAAGFCLERLGTPGAAAYRYEQALAAAAQSGWEGDKPTDLFARYRLAALYLAHNQLEESAGQHKAILAAEPQEGAVRISLAHLLQLLGRHKEAVWEYEKALCLAPDSWELQLELAEQLERMGDSDEAIVHLCRLVGKNPHFPDLHLRLANLYSNRGDDAGAAEEYVAALKLHPDYLEGHIAFARHELKCGRGENALEHFQRALTINHQSVEAYAGLAVACHRLGQGERARELMANAAKVAGNSDVLVAQVGALELQAEAAADADAAFDPRQQGEPAGEASDAESGTAPREVQREWVEAQAARYEQVLAEHPTWADVRVRYGMLLKLLGRPAEAAKAFEAAAGQNPGYVEAWVQLALVREATGDAAGAAAALETAVGIKPEYADLHYRLGLIYCNQMEFDLAMERMEEAASLNRGNADFQRHLWFALQGLQLSGRRKPTGTSADRVVPFPGQRERMTG